MGRMKKEGDEERREWSRMLRRTKGDGGKLIV